MKVGERPKFNFSRDELSLVVDLSDENNNFEFNDRIFTIRSYLRYYSPFLPKEAKNNIELNICQVEDFSDPTLSVKLNLNK